MIEICIYSAVIFSFFVYFRYTKKRQLVTSQCRGVAQISQLKDLISLTQKHRGMSSALLNGNTQARTDLVKIKRNIKSVQSNLAKPELEINHVRWDSYIDHWTRLQKNTTTITVLENFSQHTKLIENLLYLLEDIAENSALNGTQLPSLPSVGFTWRELIQTSEFVGQCRAIGVGIATMKHCSQVDKIRLAYLQQKLTNTTEHVLDHLSSVDPYTFEQKQKVELAKKQINQLNGTISNEFIDASTIVVEPKVYFEFTSVTMATLNDIFELQLRQVLSALNLTKTQQSIVPLNGVSSSV
ncbi:nitrate- and nitrite sensing domain-containing protein [Psychrosphaera sp. B3R10]|uniref:nitrate- and nitrite sensing domain-containing protein n=1 Tax=unclassified Psychrosphaera TaxID=2641570 RepID=UPI001C097BA0|nr:MULTISPECIES: nitrate- and nitrite sensing domain-containing protein [unclassified Psychrosphaera]MBU2882147.1 nitrate- and nitrite sensing domain-containing protein [Psychrosphaera sp. I2R16]MBU2988828.1 nitrate- and nitrite sensing domain-containing protein [Psychrosphaera sp. B3R10]